MNSNNMPFYVLNDGGMNGARESLDIGSTEVGNLLMRSH